MFDTDLRLIVGWPFLIGGLGVIIFFVVSVIVRAVRKSRD